MAHNPITLDEVVEGVIRRVDHDLRKSAAVTYTSETAKTDLGRMMSKVAQEIRAEAVRDITWDDVTAFGSKR